MSGQVVVGEVVVLKPNTGQPGGRLPLDQATTVTIGREADSDIRIRLPEVSRSQAVLRVTESKVFLVNRSRTNPTVIEASMFHGGQACALKPDESYLLRDGEVFVIAGRRFRLEYRPEFAHYSSIPVVAAIIPVSTLGKSTGTTPRKSAPGTPLADAPLRQPLSATKGVIEKGAGGGLFGDSVHVDENSQPAVATGTVLPASSLTGVLAKAAASPSTMAAMAAPPASDEENEDEEAGSDRAGAHRLLLPMSPLPHAIAAVLPCPSKAKGGGAVPAAQAAPSAAALPVAAAIAVIRVGASALVTSGLPPASPRAVAPAAAAATSALRSPDAASSACAGEGVASSPPPPASLTPEAAAAATAAAVADMATATGLPPGALDSPSAVHLSPTTRNTRFNTAMLGPNVTFEFPAVAVVPHDLDPESAEAATACNSGPAADAAPSAMEADDAEEEMFGTPPKAEASPRPLDAAAGSWDMADDGEAGAPAPPASDVSHSTGEAALRLAEDGRLLQTLGVDGTAALAVARSPRRSSLALMPLAASPSPAPSPAAAAPVNVCAATPPRSAARSASARGSTAASTPGSILRKSTMSATRGAGGALPTPIARAVASRRVMFGEDRVRLIPCKEEAMHKYHLTPPQEEAEEAAAAAAQGPSPAPAPDAAAVTAAAMEDVEDGVEVTVAPPQPLLQQSVEAEAGGWGGVRLNLAHSFQETEAPQPDPAAPVPNAVLVMLSMPRLPSPLQRDIISRAGAAASSASQPAAAGHSAAPLPAAAADEAASTPSGGSGVASSAPHAACEWATLPADCTGAYTGPLDDVSTGVIAGKKLWPASPDGDGACVHPPTASSAAAADAAYDFVYGVGADEATEDEESILAALVTDACSATAAAASATGSAALSSPTALPLPAPPSMAAVVAACFKGGPVTAPAGPTLTFSPFMQLAAAADPRAARGRASVLFSSDPAPLSAIKEGDIPSGAPTPVASKAAEGAPSPALGGLWGLGQRRRVPTASEVASRVAAAASPAAAAASGTQRRRRRSSTTGFPPLSMPASSLFGLSPSASTGGSEPLPAPSMVPGGAQRVVSSAVRARASGSTGAGRVSVGGSGATDCYEPAAKRCKV